jgi:hypothetical protein
MSNKAKAEKKQRNNRGTNPNSLANLKPFLKGQSGNPKGAEIGTRHRDSEVRKWTSVESEFTNPVTKQKERMTVRDAMTLSMIGAVILEKNVGAFKALNEEEYGKAAQPVDVTSNGETIFVNRVIEPKADDSTS